jgi:hypothetical protein
MDDKQGNGMQKVLDKINSLALGAVGNNQSVQQFIDKLIDEREFGDITPEVREELVKDLLVRLDDFIMARIIASLGDEDLAKFEQLLKNKASDEEIQKLTSAAIPDFTNFLTKVLVEFRAVYLGIITPPPGGIELEPDKQAEKTAGTASEQAKPASDTILPPPPMPAPSGKRVVN